MTGGSKDNKEEGDEENIGFVQKIKRTLSRTHRKKRTDWADENSHGNYLNENDSPSPLPPQTSSRTATPPQFYDNSNFASSSSILMNSNLNNDNLKGDRQSTTPNSYVSNRRQYLAPPSPYAMGDDWNPYPSNKDLENPGDIVKKKSLVRPERSKSYHRQRRQQQQAQQDTILSQQQFQQQQPQISQTNSADLNSIDNPYPPIGRRRSLLRRLQYNDTLNRDTLTRKLNNGLDPDAYPLTCWVIVSRLLTFYAQPIFLSCLLRIRDPTSQQAFREKLALCTIIFVLMSFVGFLTFGFNQALCPARTSRFNANSLSVMGTAIHGSIYNVTNFPHVDTPYGVIDLYSSAFGREIGFLFPPPKGEGYCAQILGNDFHWPCKVSGVWPPSNNKK